MQAAERLGAQTVVVHPPFRWQRRYADGFSEQVAELESRSDVLVAVENMFPFRADRFFGSGDPSIERMRKRGGRPPGVGISAFAPSYDPLDATTRTTRWTCRTPRPQAPMPGDGRRMGDGLVHLHLCDGNGASTDEHLVPGRGGTQPTVEVCQMLAASDFTRHVILEVTTSVRAPRPSVRRYWSSHCNSRAPICCGDCRSARKCCVREALMYPPRFADAMTLTPPVEDGFEANLNEHWTIGRRSTAV